MVSASESDPDRNGPREIELKLRLPDAEAYALLRRKLDGAGGFVRAVLQENLFLDGIDGEISAARVALRVRSEDDGRSTAVRLSLKSGGRRDGDVFDRSEIECLLPFDLSVVRSDPSRLLALDLAPMRRLAALVPGLSRLRVLGGFTNERRVYSVLLDLGPAGPPAPASTSQSASRIELLWELDQAVYPDGSVDYELEVELGDVPGFGEPGASAGAVSAAIRRELDRLGARYLQQPLSKYARFRERNGL